MYSGPEFLHQVFVNNCTGFQHMVSIGSVVVAIDRLNRLRVISVPSLDIIAEHDLPRAPITAMSHPNGYTNQVLIAQGNGLVLFDFSEGHTVREIPLGTAPTPEAAVGGRVTITSLAQSPYQRVYAVGLSTGFVVLVDLDDAARVQTLAAHRLPAAPVTAMAFHTPPVGPSAAPPLLATGSGLGEVAIYTLSTDITRLSAKVDVHPAITNLVFLPDGVLLTGGSDNALRKWAVEDSGDLRLHTARVGHAAPPVAIEAFDASQQVDGQRTNMIITGDASGAVRLTNLIAEGQNVVLSTKVKATAKTKAGPGRGAGPPRSGVVAIASSPLHARRVPSIATAHSGSDRASLWDVDRKAMVDRALRTGGKALVAAIAYTHTGDSVVVGGVDGGVDLYNVQSGLSKSAPAAPGLAPIVQVGTSSASSRVVAVRTDSISLYDYLSMKIDQTIDGISDSPITCAAVSDTLVAVATEDTELIIVDLTLGAVVRRFTLDHPPTRLRFTLDRTAVIAADLLGGLLTFDLAEARLVTHIRFSSPVVDFALHRPGYMVSTHAGERGVYEWVIVQDWITTETDRDEVVTRAKEVYINIPPPTVDVRVDLETDRTSDDGVTTKPDNEWARLAFADEIKQAHRTKKQRTRADVDMPFLLTTTDTLKPSFDVDPFVTQLAAEEETAAREQAESHERRVMARAGTIEWEGVPVTPFIHAVLTAAGGGSAAFLEVDSVAQVSFGIAQLEWHDAYPVNGEDVSSAQAFATVLTAALRRGTRFDALQAMLRLFLKTCEPTDPSQAEVLGELLEAQDEVWGRMRERMQKTAVGARWLLDLN